MRLGFVKSPTFIIAAPVIIAVCLLELWHAAIFQRLEWMTYDWRVRAAYRYHPPFANETTNLGLVEISDNTIAAVNDGSLGFRYGLYWPRLVYARALHELAREGAKAVAFDVLFAEERPDHPTITTSDGEMLPSDIYFARQIKKSGNIILAADHELMPASVFRTNAWSVASISAERDADGVLRRARAYQDFPIWNPIILQLAAEYKVDLARTVTRPGKIIFYRRAGDPIEVPTDASGEVATALFANPVPRGVPTHFAPYTLFRAWTMGIVLAAYDLKLDLNHAEFAPGRIILRGPNGLTRTIPVDKDNRFYVDWAMTEDDRHLTTGDLEDVLYAPIARADGQAVPNLWSNKLVVIGSTATGNELSDLGSTALESQTHLVIKHLNVANSVITGRFVHPTPEIVNLLLIVGVGLFAVWITLAASRPLTGSFLMFIFTGLYLSVATLLFMQARLWIPIVLPVACAGFVTHLSTLTYRVRAEQSEKKLIKQMFSRVLPPEIVNEVVKEKSLALGGVRRELTVYFADVRDFTELSDLSQARAMEYARAHQLPPAEAEAYIDSQARETLKTVSLYLGAIADVIKQHGGTLDKYIGDCVMAFWGAPLPNPRHAADAVRAAIAAQRCVAALNHQRQLQNQRRAEENVGRLKLALPPHPMLPILSLGTGINSGMTLVGFMGSESHLLNYTAFGREVNLASRLEGISGHGRILIGESTHAALTRDEPRLAAGCVEWPAQSVKGFREPVKTFEVPWQPSADAAIADRAGVAEQNPAVV